MWEVIGNYRSQTSVKTDITTQENQTWLVTVIDKGMWDYENVYFINYQEHYQMVC